MFKRILVPLDGSRASAKALPYAIEIAQRFGAELILMQVVAPIAPHRVTSLSAEATKISKEAAQLQEKRQVERGKRYLKAQLQQITTQGVSGSYHAILGDPAKAIIRFCQKESVDLVVMTTSGKSGIKRALLGSVADQLVRDSTVPELVIRPEMKRKSKK
jgi:nucleotide-binding universal stress UspA family protein